MPLGAFRLNSLAKFTVTAVAEVIRKRKVVTAFGNAQVDTAQSKFGGASALFDGTGDYLQTNTSSDYLLGTGDFTVECWFRIAGNSAQAQDGNRYASLFAITNGNLAANSVGLSLVILGNSSTTGTGIQLYKNTNTEENITATVSISQTTWHHAAVSKSGSSVRIFFNGTQVGSTTTSSTIWGSSTFFGRIGRLFDTGFIDDINGHIDELRLSNTARYTTNFTPSTTPFVNDANTLLLIHADGPDASTYFEDDNGIRSAKFITAVGNTQVDTAQSQFGGSAALFDGTGDYLTVGNSGFLFQAGESVTMECWIRLGATAAEYYGIMSLGSSRGSSSNEYYVFLRSASETGFVHKVKVGTDYADIILGTTQIVVNTWYHIAVVRNSNTYTLYVNGTAEGTNSSRTTDVLGQNTGMKVGALADGSLVWNGHIDEVRVSDIARYTTNFTAPTQPFVNDENTLLLIHADGTDATTYFADDNGVRSPKGISAIGNAQVSTAQSQFGGASALFDGADDWLAISPTSSFVLGTNDWTVEMWVRPNGTQASVIFDTRPFGSGNENAICLYYTGTNLTYYSGGNIRITGANFVQTTWQHIALVRNGDDHRLYINGTQSGSTYTATNNITLVNTSVVTLGTSSNSLGQLDYIGHIDEVRVSDIARYTTNFTAPTAAFTNDDNTLLLIHADGNNSSKVFIDDNEQTFIPPPLAIPTLTFVSSSFASSSTSISMPSGSQAGDIVFVIDRLVGVNSTVRSPIISGTSMTTYINSGGGTSPNQITQAVFASVLPSSGITTITNLANTTTTAHRTIALLFRPSSPITSITWTNTGAQYTTGDPSSQTVSVSGQAQTAVAMAIYNSTGVVSPRTSSITMQEIVHSATTTFYVKYKLYTEGEARTNFTVDMDDEGAGNQLLSFYVKFN
jgi:hypothetical protein